MVLQRDLPVPIWGWGEKGEKIYGLLCRTAKKQPWERSGEWMVKLDKLKANAKPSNLTVKGNNEIKLENILVGEVWICSGQSNMEWKVSPMRQPERGNCRGQLSEHPLFDVPDTLFTPSPG